MTGGTGCRGWAAGLVQAGRGQSSRIGAQGGSGGLAGAAVIIVACHRALPAPWRERSCSPDTVAGGKRACHVLDARAYPPSWWLRGFLLLLAGMSPKIFLKNQPPFKVIFLTKRPYWAQSHLTLGCCFLVDNRGPGPLEKFWKVTVSWTQEGLTLTPPVRRSE